MTSKYDIIIDQLKPKMTDIDKFLERDGVSIDKKGKLHLTGEIKKMKVHFDGMYISLGKTNLCVFVRRNTTFYDIVMMEMKLDRKTIFTFVTSGKNEDHDPFSLKYMEVDYSKKTDIRRYSSDVVQPWFRPSEDY